MQVANACLTGTLSAQDTVTGYGGGSLLEQPEDAGCEPYASIWVLPEVTAMEALNRLHSQRVLDRTRWLVGCC